MQYQRPVQKYYIAVVFVDYLTKRPEICATFNQSAYTIVKLLVEKITSSHGIPSQLLSDYRGHFCQNSVTRDWNVTGISQSQYYCVPATNRWLS